MSWTFTRKHKAFFLSQKKRNHYLYCRAIARVFFPSLKATSQFRCRNANAWIWKCFFLSSFSSEGKRGLKGEREKKKLRKWKNGSAAKKKNSLLARSHPPKLNQVRPAKGTLRGKKRDSNTHAHAHTLVSPGK